MLVGKQRSATWGTYVPPFPVERLWHASNTAGRKPEDSFLGSASPEMPEVSRGNEEWSCYLTDSERHGS